MNPVLTFFSGVILAGLFGWYFLTDNDRHKRILGSVLTVLLVAGGLVSFLPPDEKIALGLDLKGGTSFLVQLKLDSEDANAPKKVTPEMLDQAREVIRKRVDSMGTSEPIIAPAGEDRILVQIPGLSAAKLEEAKQQLYRPAKLDFKLVHPRSDAILAGSMPLDPAYKIESHMAGHGSQQIEEKLVVRKTADIPGSKVTGAHAFFDSQGWGVSLRFNPEGAGLFAKLTQENVGQRFAIMLDGKVMSAPSIREPITGGNAQITGNFTEEEARNLSSVLENPLQTPVVILEERSASASLGADSIHSGVFSGVIGVVLTVICVLIYYRFSGLVANLALVVNVILLFGAMGLLGTVLTLPGIAGIILTLGMAIDANVLIYERLREELAERKSLRGAVNAAFEKAFSAIFDSNVTTLITALILFWKASGPVKGFAVALIIGIVATLFTALVVTRNLFLWALHIGLLKEVSMANLIRATSFNFMAWRRAAVIGSLAVIFASIGIFTMRGEKNFGVDFKGGDRVVLEAVKTKPEIGAVRAAVEALKLGEVAVQTEKSAKKEFYTVRGPKDSGPQITEALKQKFPEAEFSQENIETVGSLVGGELARNSVIALVLGMLGILVYVTVRFEFSFALGALVALLHDVIITIGVFALLGRELSLVTVGAVLTIAGYSVNDTIVVFDRIREGLQTGRKGTVLEIMNLSVNETLSRTILTGGVTLLTTVALFFFGGPVLADFALTILIGVLVGTYSSVFVASPIVLWWSGRHGIGLREEVTRSMATPSQEGQAPA
ncbi:MAG: Protein translocase subunit SecD [Verrucomicrobiota bacterium]|jgi:SecD/SecF fusion protein